MKVKALILSSMFALAGCDKIGQNAQDALPNPSAAQEQAAEQAYAAFKSTDFEQLYTYFEPELKADFIVHEHEMRKFAKSIPQQEITNKKIAAKYIEKSSDKPSLYLVSYEYAYGNKNLVQYDVGFDQAGGSDKIRKFDVKVFGASTN